MEVHTTRFGAVDISDDREMQNTPENMAFVALNYVFDFYGGTLNLNGNWSFKDDITQFETPSEEIDQDSYNFYNASIVWTSPEENWLLGVHGKNLGDEDIRTAGYCFGFSGSVD